MRLATFRAAALCLWLAAAISGPAGADPYRLTVGDRVAVAVFGEAEGWQGTVDLDGRVRLPGFGSLPLAGRTLDEAEAALAARMRESAFFADPQVSVAIEAYAPIVVGGDVRNPGVFPFSPGLTAATAAGLAGGLAGAVFDAEDRALARATFMGQLREAEQSMIRRSVVLARLTAQLEGRETLEADDVRLPPGLDARAETAGYPRALIAAEGALMAAERESLHQQRGALEATVGELERQIAFLDQRLEVQRDIVTLQQEELAAAEELNQRGLRTRGAMARFESLEAQAREELLEVEATLSQARIRMLQTRETLGRLDADRRARILAEAGDARAGYQELLARRGMLLEKLTLVDEGAVADLLSEDALRIVYRIERSGADDATETSEDGTTLMPGDHIVVEVIVPDGMLTR
ncbi:MAG: polysaccharide biosynthesis/export family protein [Pseudomonadota bacterium]